MEGTSPTDFSNTAPGYALPFGTDIVRGVLHSGVDTSDWFEFVDLKPGTAFSLQGTYNPFGQERGVSFQVFNSSSVQLGSATLEGAGRTIHGTVPVDGKLLVDVHFAQFGNPSYQFALTAETVPEPAVGWGAGLAVAAALAWKRKRDAGA